MYTIVHYYTVSCPVAAYACGLKTADEKRKPPGRGTGTRRRYRGVSGNVSRDVWPRKTEKNSNVRAQKKKNKFKKRIRRVPRAIFTTGLRVHNGRPAAMVPGPPLQFNTGWVPALYFSSSFFFFDFLHYIISIRSAPKVLSGSRARVYSIEIFIK